jgi:hypothetical protein
MMDLFIEILRPDFKGDKCGKDAKQAEYLLCHLDNVVGINATSAERGISL